MNRNRNASVGLGVLLGLFFTVNLASSALFRSARLDLTEAGLYTLSNGTRSILRELDEPIHLRFYFSREMANDLPDIKSYGQRVQELLEEYVALAGGEIELDVVDPDPFSEEEDRAVGFGLQGAPANAAGEPLYFGLAGTNSTDQEEVIPFFQMRREEFLEYDLTKLVHNLANPEKAVVGVLSSLPLAGGPMNPMDPRSSAPPWFIVETVRQLFDVRNISATDVSLPDDLDILVLAHPKGLEDEMLYSIDQFALGGGRVVAFVDPFCEADQPPSNPRNPMASMGADRSSDLGPLLEAWGVELVDDKIAVDRMNAQRVGWQGQPIDYVAWMGLRTESFAADDPVTSDLGQLNMATPGKLARIDEATTSFTPVVWTSDEGSTIGTSDVSFVPDPAKLLSDYSADDEPITLAARLSGEVQSAYPDGNPSDSADEENEDDYSLESEEGSGDSTHRESGEIQVFIVADADMLADRWWVNVQNFFGQRIAMPNANNADLLVNVLENLSGSSDMISLRSRGSYTRPFDRVLAIRREAEQRFRAEEQALETKLQETERRINELQRQKDGAKSAIILSPEQRAEITRFREERIDTRKRLREVRHQQAKEIERLGGLLKLLNIGLIPLGLAVFSLIRGTSTIGRD